MPSIITSAFYLFSFLGPEKLLEVWFAISQCALPGAAGPNGLKKISAGTWKEMLDLVDCKILSVITFGDVDAYLLSESSMFVFPHKLVLKTCGTTTLLYGLPRILELAVLEAGFPYVPANAVIDSPAAAIPYRIFYSRKNFQYPDKQRGPHRSWQDEVKYLDQHFSNGSAYMIGKMNGEHWYLYFTTPNTNLTPPATPETFSMGNAGIGSKKSPNEDGKSGSSFCKGSANEQDYTLEILMTDLDEDQAAKFWLNEAISLARKRRQNPKAEVYRAAAENRDILLAQAENGKHKDDNGELLIKGQRNSLRSPPVSTNAPPDVETLQLTDDLTTEGHALGQLITEASGLADIYPRTRYPDAKIDSYLFDPCGFSANGVVPTMNGPAGASETHYFTIHVTPEPHCSYASFETNVPAKPCDRDTSDIIEHVVSIFRPGRFSVTLFEGKADLNERSCLEQERTKQNDRMDFVPDYRRVDRIFHDLDDYDLVFRYHERLDWKGGAPRLGEFMY